MEKDSFFIYSTNDEKMQYSMHILNTHSSTKA